MREIMKKSYLIAAACVAIVSLSCSKESEDKNVYAPKNLITFDFSSASSDTKTVFGEKNNNKYPILWTDDDNVGIGLNDSDTLSTVSVEPQNEGVSAKFRAIFKEAESYHFMLMSPASTIKELKGNTFYAEIPAIQSSTSTGPDPDAQLLYAIKDFASTGDIPNPISVEFNHFTAYFHVTFKNVEIPEGNSLQSVVVTGGDNCYLAGRNTLDVSETPPSFTSTVTRASRTVTVNTPSLDIEKKTVDIWFAVRAGDFSGKELTFEINTDKKYLTRTITMRSGSELTPGGVAAFSVDVEGLNWQEPEEYVLVESTDDLHWGDEIIIAGAENAADDNSNNIALGISQNGNNRSGTGINRISKKILNPSSSVELIQLKDGLIPGSFALYATKNKGYLYAAGTSGTTTNALKTASTLNEKGSWRFSFGANSDGDSGWYEKGSLAIIKAEKSDNGRPYIRCNKVDNLFASYIKNTSVSPVRIYRKNEEPDTTPRFNVTDSEGNTPSDAIVSYEAQSIPIYVFGNVEWTANITGDATFVSTGESTASGNGPEILTLSIPEITGDGAVYTVTVTTDADVDKKSFACTFNQIGHIQKDDVLFWEQYWTGSQDGDSVVQYQNSGNATTQVFGGFAVVFSSDSSTKFLGWPDNGNVFLPSPYEGALSTEGKDVNLRINKNGGYLKVEGVPCLGVKTATLTYKLNRNGTEYSSPSSDSEGVTVGSATRTSGLTSDWGKSYILYTSSINFPEKISTFNFKITDTHNSNHIYIADIKVVVTSVY